MSKPFEITTLKARDWSQVRRIYLEGIATGDATFETRAPSWKKWNAAHRREARLVARAGDRILGWAALSPVSSRAVYAGVAEVSVYVAAAARSHGVGRALLSAVIEASETAGIWTLQAGIFPENAASLALHGSCRFRLVGTRDRIGRRNGVWRDVCLLERRSASQMPLPPQRGRRGPRTTHTNPASSKRMPRVRR